MRRIDRDSRDKVRAMKVVSARSWAVAVECVALVALRGAEAQAVLVAVALTADRAAVASVEAVVVRVATT